MLEFLELEETVGRAWHRFVGDTSSWPNHPRHAVHLADIKSQLAVCYRGFGGSATSQVQKARQQASAHRLRFRQVIGLGEERSEQPRWDGSNIYLPTSIAFFEDVELNKALFFWLTAYMATAKPSGHLPSDPARRDLARIESGRRNSAEVLRAFPGLADRYARLAHGFLSCRSRGKLPKAEEEIEDYLRLALIFPVEHGLPHRFTPTRQSAPAGYLPMLPVPLWPDYVIRHEEGAANADDLPSQGTDAKSAKPSHSANRKKDSDERKRDPFILNRFEKILAMAEMVNVDRPTDDREDDEPGAADELDEITLSQTREKPKSRFHFDLDLSPEACDPSRIEGEHLYPEWNFRRQEYQADHCRVIVGTSEAVSAPEVPQSDPAIIRKVKRQFEVLRPRREVRRAQLDGNDLDLEAVVRSRVDLLTSGATDDRIYECSMPAAHELATSILVDVSLSTDSWIDNRRVLDVEKDALDVFARGLSACGDSFSIQTFTSRRRDWVRVDTVKAFSEPFSPTTAKRIAGLRPGYYTRMGAAIRHASRGLHVHGARRKLLLILTDGKPNDVDYYEGKFALEDSRRAVAEARALGQAVFAVTIDRLAEEYLPAIFGRSGFALVSDISKLASALPAIYRSLTA